MNKKTVSIVSLVSGVLTAVVALFYLISGIINLTNFSSNNGAKANSYIAISAVIILAVAALLGLFSYFIIKKYTSNSECGSVMAFPSLVYFCYAVISIFIGMIFWGFDNARGWVLIVLSVAGAVLLILSLVGSLDNLVKNVLALIAIGIGFVMSIISLTNTDGIGVALNIFLMFMFIAYFLYYLFNMLVNDQANGTQAKEE